MTVQEIIDTVEAARKEKGLTWREIFAECQVTRNAMCYWRNGKCGPRVDTLQRLLNAVGKKLEIMDI